MNMWFSRRRVQACSGDLLRLEALAADGTGVLGSGAVVRWLEVTTPVNPLIHDSDSAEAIARGFEQVMARLPDDRQSLQFVAQATPLALDALLDRDHEVTHAAAQKARGEGRGELAKALERLGVAGEQSIRTHGQALAAMDLRYFVVCPWMPAPEVRLRVRWPSRSGPLTLTRGAFERALRESARHTDGVRADLEATGLEVSDLVGEEVAQLLWARFAPAQADSTESPDLDVELPGTLAELDSPEYAVEHALELRRVLCPEAVSTRDRRALRIGGHVEQTRYLGSLPEQTWLGWLLYLMQAPRPWTLSVHIHGTDRMHERMLHRRRYRRIYGNNRGTEMRGRPLDPDQHAQEVEASELNTELALTGAGVYHVSCYLSVRDPAGDAEAVGEILDGITREVAGANDAHLHPGVSAQRRLLSCTLPAGSDPARRTRKYVARNVGDTTPLVGTRCGSPSGIPIGYSSIGRTLERLDLFDPGHPNHILVVVGESGSGKTTLVNKIYARSIARGGQGAVIERGGHYDFLVSLIPGAVTVRLGSADHAICPWDTQDPAHVGPEKVDYLIALHATLVGTGRPDEYGLSALEQNLLGRAIRQVYERCALTAEAPRELLLQETLMAWAAEEAHAGGVQMADSLRDLAARLHNFVGDGPYSYLTDRQTTVPTDAPLVVFDTRSIPDHFAPAAMFEIVEHITDRAEKSHQRHLEEGGHGDESPFLLTLEEVWKLVEGEATGRWVNELPRRSRHLRLGFIGVSQGFADFDNRWGRALIDNAAQTFTFRQSPRQIRFLQSELGLTSEEVEAINQLKTVKRDYATGYWVNGVRGRNSITVRLGDLEYWIATHDPENDEPVRQLALREAGGDPWRALRLLADPDWHHHLAEGEAA